MINKIKNKIDDYIEFNSSEIFEISKSTRIFGGCLRDILANKDIHDIDILCYKYNLDKISKLLISYGYKESLSPRDLYFYVKHIDVPITFIKNNKIVQLTVPKNGYINMSKLVSNVDISCCSISYDGSHLYENYPNAIQHAIKHYFSVNKKALMYTHDHSTPRIFKLQKRGWVEINNKEILRDISIDIIIDETHTNNYYIKEYEE